MLKRQTTAMQVAEVLRMRIIRGELPDGAQIRQEAIASELGVSRIPVREALKQLEAEGLVTIETHRGAVVSKLSPTEIEELFDLRILLESWLLEQAVPALTEDDLAKAEACCAAMENERTVERWGALNWDLHHVLYAPANRPETLRILDRIHGQIDRYVRLQISLSSGQARANKEHREILRRCREGRADKAIAANRAHIDGVWESLKAQLEKRLEGA